MSDYFRMNLWSHRFFQNTKENSLHRAEILTIFRLYFGRNDDFINSFWNCLTFNRFHCDIPPYSVPLISKNSPYLYIQDIPPALKCFDFNWGHQTLSSAICVKMPCRQNFLAQWPGVFFCWFLQAFKKRLQPVKLRFQTFHQQFVSKCHVEAKFYSTMTRCFLSADFCSLLKRDYNLWSLDFSFSTFFCD